MKKNVILCALIVFTQFYNNAFAQIQLGEHIVGAAAGYELGQSVALSANGQRLAVGAPLNTNNWGYGAVQIYEWTNETWTPLGNEIIGQQTYDFLGESVAFSSDGNMLAIGCITNTNAEIPGHVEVYEWVNGTWVQLGNDIAGEANGDHFGQALSISADGTRFISGAVYNQGSGHARVFEWQDGIWVQMGNDIDGAGLDDFFGGAVSISDDGTRVAVGATQHDGIGKAAGHVRIYDWSGEAWVQTGNINGLIDFDLAGKSVSLSADGNRLALSANTSLDWSLPGVVRVYEWDDGAWNRLGDDIVGAAEFDNFGISATLSASGNRLAIGAIFNNNVLTGYVEMYEFSGGAWSKVGNTIYNSVENILFGQYTTISADGTHVAIGAPRSNLNGEWSGHVEVYTFPVVSTTEQDHGQSIEIYPNPADNMLYATGDNIEMIRIINAVGQLVKTQKAFSGALDISDLSPGIYFVKLWTRSGAVTKKIIKG